MVPMKAALRVCFCLTPDQLHLAPLAPSPAPQKTVNGLQTLYGQYSAHTENLEFCRNGCPVGAAAAWHSPSGLLLHDSVDLPLGAFRP